MLKNTMCPKEKAYFTRFLYESEKSGATVEKYVSDAEDFVGFLRGRKLSKEVLLEYKDGLIPRYSVRTLNTKLASVNSYLCFKGKPELKMSYEKVQTPPFRDDALVLSQEEYFRLIDTAMKNHDVRLALLVQTLGSTGMRVSEVEYVTVEAVKEGKVSIRLKRKTRTVILPDRLAKKLGAYAELLGIESGPVFLTKNNNVLDRTNIYRMLRELGKQAHVSEKKVFPHNFRHFFALSYYNSTRDMLHLSDLLGHTNINTTRIYTQTSLEEFKEEINSLELVK